MASIERLPAITVGRVAGIQVRLDATFPVLGVLLAASVLRSTFPTVADYAVCFAIVLAGVPVSILIHELGHALAAQAFGRRSEAIQIGGFWGFVLLEGRSRSAREAVAILIAGPLANAMMFLALWMLLGQPAITGHLYFHWERGQIPELWTPGVRTAVRWLAMANLGMVILNLLPAFPLDGGRIVRVLLGLIGGLGDGRAVRTVAVGGMIVGTWSVFGIAAYPALLGLTPLLLLANYAIYTGEVAAPDI